MHINTMMELGTDLKIFISYMHRYVYYANKYFKTYLNNKEAFVLILSDILIFLKKKGDILINARKSTQK